MKRENPYKVCPVYESERFLLRSVQESDAEDLLACYSDKAAVRLMNSDRCTSDFYYQTVDEMIFCIRDWLGSYQRGLYVRFAIVDKQNGKAVGTIELYDKPRYEQKKLGILRLDLSSAYEKQNYLNELFDLSIKNFYDTFSLSYLMTKAIPEAGDRISSLLNYGFSPMKDNPVMPFGDYFLR